jgi:hypothetical protein
LGHADDTAAAALLLLLLQAVLVQLVTMSYEFVLLKAANCEAMKRFSVFLALPSATLRSMAARQMQVGGCRCGRMVAAAEPCCPVITVLSRVKLASLSVQGPVQWLSANAEQLHCALRTLIDSIQFQTHRLTTTTKVTLTTMSWRPSTQQMLSNCTAHLEN